MLKHSVSEVCLKNGLKGLFIDIPNTSVVSAQINFRAGEYLVDESKWETAHLLEHLVLCANSDFKKARDFQASIERFGAYTNASTGVYDITYEMEASSSEANRVLKLLVAAISAPAFLKDEFITELQTVEEELIMRSNDHFRELNIRLKKSMGLKVLTDKQRLKLLKNIHRSDILKHYANTHTINNARFIISGDVKNIQDSLESTLNTSLRLKKGKRFELPNEQPSGNRGVLYVPKKEVPNTYMYIDVYGSKLLSFEQQQSIRLISTMLTETLYSRIFGLAREKGLVYGMGSGLMRTGSVSGMWFGAQVSQKNLLKLSGLIYDELSRIKNNIIDDQDLQVAKDYLLGKMTRSYQTAESLTEAYSHYFNYDRYYDMKKEIDYINRIEAKEVCACFNQLLSAKVGAVGFLGKIDKDVSQEVYKILSDLWK